MSLAPIESNPTARAIAERFVSARLAARATADYPGSVPATLAEAYAIQEEAIGLYRDRIVGWKVGGVPPAQQPALGVHRVAGPVFAGRLWAAADGGRTPLPAIAGGFAAVESEFVARIGRDADPARLEWTLADAMAQVDSVFVGVELAGSPLPTINDLGSVVVASDFGNNAGLVLGPEVIDWRDRLDHLEVETVINGQSLGVARHTALAGGAMESVRFLLEHCAQRGRPLQAGALVSTGAVTGVHRVDAGDEAVCIFRGVAELYCPIVRAAAGY
ncbi:2-keto-4-pentenoate hydratase [Brevundimonas sp.]|uniref:2-keto-4-pentenoate hydratase n=1 Tax=Brevundimonas sp. TaxID=1871086 RepID=UPI002D4AD589|nr:fumarylacetoacetate hydrolase family protein [Brevundimonas sp.]HYC98723.1 fumarylacetoacetate hydrolase family protein [Brevundimonas sp.]